MTKTFHCRFKPGEEEQLVLYDAPADRAAIDIAQAVGRFVPIEEKVPGVRDSVLVQRKGGAVEIIRSRFGDHRRRGAAGKPRLGVEVVGGNVHHLDGFRRRHITGVMGQPDIDALGPVNARVVAVARGPVDVGGQ